MKIIFPHSILQGNREQALDNVCWNMLHVHVYDCIGTLVGLRENRARLNADGCDCR